MKLFLSILLVTLFMLGCHKSENQVIEAEISRPYFNQVNTNFETEQIQCLLNQWYANKYNSEGIVLKVINDAQSYQSFFSCASNVVLPAINFTAFSLIVGMKADYGNLLNTPVNISGISQNFVKTGNSVYSLNVVVTGKPSAGNVGGEWFAFTSLVPKVQGEVKLNISYVFK